jgi:hypothetical protein
VGGRKISGAGFFEAPIKIDRRGMINTMAELIECHSPAFDPRVVRIYTVLYAGYNPFLLLRTTYAGYIGAVYYGYIEDALTMVYKCLNYDYMVRFDGEWCDALGTISPEEFQYECCMRVKSNDAIRACLPTCD